MPGRYVARSSATFGQPVRMRPPWGWSDTTGSWTWPGFEGTEVDVEVYTGAEEVALLLDGVEIDRAVVGSRCPKVAELRATYRPGTLEAVAYSAGMCSANPVTTERFVDPTWSTFEGRALAVVRPIAVGQVQVRVEADGLDPAEVTVIVR